MQYFIILIPLVANMMLDVWISQRKCSDTQTIGRRHWARIYGTMVMIAGYVCFQRMGITSFEALVAKWILNSKTLMVTISDAIIILVASLMIVSRQPNVNNSISIQYFDAKRKWETGIVWIVYLICYESYWRILLLPLKQNIPGESLILINVLIYAALHLHRGINEILAAIPFGFFVCYCTVHTGSVWPAFVAHAVLAWVTHLGVWPIYTRFSLSNRFPFAHTQKQTP